jgi:hypothetical protein
MIIHQTPAFKRRFRKLSPEDQKRVAVALRIFAANPFDPRLRNHKLSGSKKEDIIRLRFQSDTDRSQKISYASYDNYADMISLKWNWYQIYISGLRSQDLIHRTGRPCSYFPSDDRKS